MLAGLPKAPSRYNPVVNPQRALERRNYVLRRMHQLGFIDGAVYRRALARSWMVERYGEEAYTAGYRVYTTIEPRLQARANEALRKGLIDYEFRYGYRGPERQVDPFEAADPAQWAAILSEVRRLPGLATASGGRPGPQGEQAATGRSGPRRR